MYSSPNSSLEENNKLLNQINLVSELATKQQNKFLLVGDFNYKGIDWERECCGGTNENKFFNCINKNYLTQFVQSPTHKRADQNATLIDLVFANDPNFVQNLQHHAPFGASHHEVLTFALNYSVVLNKPNQSIKYLLDKGDYSSMRQEVGETDWDNLLIENESVDIWWDKIENILNSAKEKFIPKKKILNNKVKRSFVAPPSLVDYIKLKRKTYKLYKKYPTPENFALYVTYRNIVNDDVRRVEKEKEVKIAKSAKKNPKALYQYIQSKTKPREAVPDLQKNNGELTTSSEEKAQVLNEFFGSVFTDEADSDYPECKFEVESPLNDLSITEEQMCKVLTSLKVSKSPGPDLIHPRLLRELAQELSYPLKKLFNKTTSEGKIPAKWKIAEVRPIHKKGSRTSPNNYRPVSLTSVVCKVFECFVRDALYNHLITNNLLSDDQFGFCQGRSCVTQLLATLNDWMLNLDNGIPTDAIYLDFSKAFDSVPHGRLVHKLEAYGVKGKVLNWVADFLSDRSQFVSINECKSSTIPVTSGVPQGSVLGPTLFIYYINDLPLETDRKVRVFADDSKLYSGVSTPEDRDKLQTGIDALVRWSKKWLMKFNSDKCKVLHIGKNNHRFKYTMTDGDVVKELSTTECEKDLGVNVDSLLTFDTHITNVTKKGRQMAGMINRNITYKTPEVMIPLFKAYTRSHLEYANSVWHPYLKKHMSKLEKVQKQFTKRIAGFEGLKYHQRLSKLKLPSLEYRQIRGDLIEVFKITHGIYDTKSTSSLFVFSHNTATRGHPFKLILKRSNTKQVQNFFTNRVIELWNSLPVQIVCEETVNSFKNKLDLHFSHLMYKTDLNMYFPFLH